MANNLILAAVEKAERFGAIIFLQSEDVYNLAVDIQMFHNVHNEVITKA